jgi:hypothetical protein
MSPANPVHRLPGAAPTTAGDLGRPAVRAIPLRPLGPPTAASIASSTAASVRPSTASSLGQSTAASVRPSTAPSVRPSTAPTVSSIASSTGSPIPPPPTGRPPPGYLQRLTKSRGGKRRTIRRKRRNIRHYKNGRSRRNS